ncbi:MAG: hypothetical protein JWN52_3583 [Actinomycetia bacterium]|nr:hypothetical protein [Actinomycetes bacterium]
MSLSPAATQVRQTALDAALAMHLGIRGDLTLRGGKPEAIAAAENEIRSTAEIFAVWINGTTSLRLSAGPVSKQTTGRRVSKPNLLGAAIMQIHDDEKFTLTVDTRDAKGFETADEISWLVDDGTVVSLSVSPDGRSCDVVAGSPGSAVITVTDTSTTPALVATEAVDVVPGGTATIAIAEGDVSKQ